MVITKDTELYSLVQSDKVISIITNVSVKLHSYIYNRNFTLKKEIANGHLNEKYIVYSKPVYYDKANDVIKGYERVKADATDLMKEISKAAVIKHISEIDELITCLNRELEKISDAISSLQSEYLDNMDAVKNAYIPEEASGSVSLNRSALSQYGGGAFLAGYYTLTSEYDRSSVSNRVHRAYYQTYDPRGVIEIQENFQDKYKTKLEAAKKLKQELEIKLENYSARYDDKGNRLNDSTSKYDPTKIYDKDGNEINPQNKETNSNAIGELKKGDKVYIEGKEYEVVGYVTLANGEQRAIYVYKPGALTGSHYAYLDAEGNVQTFEIVRAGKDQSITVDGQKVNMTYLVGNETFTPSEVDKANASTTTDNILEYNGQQYTKLKDYTGTYDTITTDTGTYQLYSNNKTNNAYFVDDTGEVRLAQYKYVDGKLQYVPVDTTGTVSGNTLSYNGDTYSKIKTYTGEYDTVTTDTGTYELYSNNTTNDAYYVDNTGEVKLAEYKYVDGKMQYVPVETATSGNSTPTNVTPTSMTNSSSTTNVNSSSASPVPTPTPTVNTNSSTTTSTVSGDTLSYNGDTYSKIKTYSGEYDTVTTDTGTYDLYSNNTTNNAYYVDNTGEVKLAQYKYVDGKMQYAPVDTTGTVSGNTLSYNGDTYSKIKTYSGEYDTVTTDTGTYDLYSNNTTNNAYYVDNTGEVKLAQQKYIDGKMQYAPVD